MNKKISLFLITLILVGFLLSGCEEIKIVKEETVSWENQIVYIYYELHPKTNGRGGIIRYDRYLIAGVAKHNGDIVQYEYLDHQSPTIKLGNEDKIVFHTNRVFYEDNTYRDGSCWKEIFLTKGTLSNIGNGG